MAKQNGTIPKIDEDFMRELISQGVPGKQDIGKPDDMPQETQAETAQAEKPTSRKRLKMILFLRREPPERTKRPAMGMTNPTTRTRKSPGTWLGMIRVVLRA